MLPSLLCSREVSQLSQSVGYILPSPWRSLYHVTNELSVKDKHDLYLSSRLAA